MDEPSFANYVAQRRLNLGKAQKDLAAALSYTPQAISKFEATNSAFPIDQLPELCFFLNCSLDDIFKRNLADPCFKETPFDIQQVGKRLRVTRQKANKTQAEIAALCGTSARAVRNYESGQTVPSYQTLEKWCEACEVTPEGLLSGEMADVVIVEQPAQIVERPRRRSFIPIIVLVVVVVAASVSTPFIVQAARNRNGSDPEGSVVAGLTEDSSSAPTSMSELSSAPTSISELSSSEELLYSSEEQVISSEEATSLSEEYPPMVGLDYYQGDPDFDPDAYPKTHPYINYESAPDKIIVDDPIQIYSCPTTGTQNHDTPFYCGFTLKDASGEKDLTAYDNKLFYYEHAGFYEEELDGKYGNPYYLKTNIKMNGSRCIYNVRIAAAYYQRTVTAFFYDGVKSDMYFEDNKHYGQIDYGEIVSEGQHILHLPRQNWMRIPFTAIPYCDGKIAVGKPIYEGGDYVYPSFAISMDRVLGLKRTSFDSTEYDITDVEIKPKGGFNYELVIRNVGEEDAIYIEAMLLRSETTNDGGYWPGTYFFFNPMIIYFTD
ncbi:MAG: helix-turn-helix transcriptional regulator [Bacilli bacterium]|nr:helix-turn-helix transcriptional regulator [Bacilli bacterium]